MIKLDEREPGTAAELLAEALRLTQAAGDRRVEAQVLNLAGEACLLAAEPARAAGRFEEALAIVRDIGDPVGEAHVLGGAGVAKIRQGELSQARSALQRTLELAGTTGEPLAEARAVLGLSELALTSGDPAQAIILAQQAAGIFRRIGAPLYEARALALLGDAHAAHGDRAGADAALAQAAACAQHWLTAHRCVARHQPADRRSQIDLPGLTAITAPGPASRLAGCHRFVIAWRGPPDGDLEDSGGTAAPPIAVEIVERLSERPEELVVRTMREEEMRRTTSASISSPGRSPGC